MTRIILDLFVKSLLEVHHSLIAVAAVMTA